MNLNGIMYKIIISYICFALDEDREQLWAVLHTVLDINVPYNAGNFSAD
jgi:hypothetical protein